MNAKIGQQEIHASTQDLYTWANYFGKATFGSDPTQKYTAYRICVP